MPGNNVRYEIEIAKEVVEKDLPNLDNRLVKIIKKKLFRLEENPFIGKPLTGALSNCCSLKISKFRVIYKVFKDRLLILVVAIGKRDNLYIYKTAERRIE